MERYPLNWPKHKPRTAPGDRKNAQFNKKVYNGKYHEHKQLSIDDAIKRVEKELDDYTPVGKDYRIPPTSIIISTNLPTNKKGIPYGNMGEPADPGAAVYFNLDGRDYCLPCDKWNRVADNLAAIAAHLNALRGIERWGVGQQHDVYTGFKALPERAGESKDAWWMILQVQQNAPADIVKSAWKRMSAKYHPDNISTGNRAKFDLVQQAYKEALANQ